MAAEKKGRMDVEDRLLVPNRSEIRDNEPRKTVKCVITVTEPRGK